MIHNDRDKILVLLIGAYQYDEAPDNPAIVKPIADDRQPRDPYFGVKCVFDAMDFADMLTLVCPKPTNAEEGGRQYEHERAAAKAMTPFVPEPMHEYLEGGRVIRVTGSVEQIARFLGAYLADLTRETGGDDDAYDYWPDGVSCAWQIACDLDQHVGGDTHRESMRVWYDRYSAMYGGVPEFEHEGVTHGAGFDYRDRERDE